MGVSLSAPFIHLPPEWRSFTPVGLTCNWSDRPPALQLGSESLCCLDRSSDKMKPLWGAWQSVYTFTREHVSSSALLHSWQWVSGFVVSVLKGVFVGCGEVCESESEFVTERATTERVLLFVCDYKWIFLKVWKWVLCGLTSPHPAILGCPRPLSLPRDVSGGGNPVVAPIVISIVFHWVVSVIHLYI